MKKVLIFSLFATFIYPSCKQQCTLDCQNGSKCVDAPVSGNNRNTGYVCECIAGYEGSTCQLRIVERLFGTYAVLLQPNANCFLDSSLVFDVNQFDATTGSRFLIGNITANYINYTQNDRRYNFSINNQTTEVSLLGSDSTFSLSGSGYVRLKAANSAQKDTLVLTLRLNGSNTNCTAVFVK